MKGRHAKHIFDDVQIQNAHIIYHIICVNMECLVIVLDSKLKKKDIMFTPLGTEEASHACVG